MITVNIAGKHRHFMFGTYTFKLIREATGLEHVEDVFEGIANKKTDDNGNTTQVRSDLEHVEFISSFLHACAIHGARTAKEKVDFDEVEVSDWIDEIGLEKSINLIGDLIQSYSARGTEQKKTTVQREAQ